MGTRYEDQPAEHWAGPESLDPTPVWKQYVLIAALLLVGLIVVVATAVLALAPQFVTPPALVPGDRLVLSSTDIPSVGGRPTFISRPVVDDGRSFYLTQPEKGVVLAFRAHWPPEIGAADCAIEPAPGPNNSQLFGAPNCRTPIAVRLNVPFPVFDLRGTSTNGFRGLDQYLVSMSGDRVIVNLSRVIESSERTNAPVPTGIPQPQATP